LISAVDLLDIMDNAGASARGGNQQRQPARISGELIVCCTAAKARPPQPGADAQHNLRALLSIFHKKQTRLKHLFVNEQVPRHCWRKPA